MSITRCRGRGNQCIAMHREFEASAKGRSIDRRHRGEREGGKSAKDALAKGQVPIKLVVGRFRNGLQVGPGHEHPLRRRPDDEPPDVAPGSPHQGPQGGIQPLEQFEIEHDDRLSGLLKSERGKAVGVAFNRKRLSVGQVILREDRSIAAVVPSRKFVEQAQPVDLFRQ